jgi:hypothetical protein
MRRIEGERGRRVALPFVFRSHTMRPLVLALLFTTLAATPLLAQSAPATAPATAPVMAPDDEEPGIQDNSILTEEAYNQEPGVVQHINQWQRDTRSGDWEYVFTQEWPAPGITHQLSYSLPLMRSEGRSGRIGDVSLNYRYQLAGTGETAFAATPRFTVTLPTGDWRHGEGSGAIGYSGAMAFSWVTAPQWNVHFDVDAGFTPRAKVAEDVRADLQDYSVATNVVWLPAKRINFMVESVFSRSGGDGGWANDLVISPAVRWAYNFPSGLQIVPAVGFPIGVGPSAGQRSVLLYLSFEHAFRRAK